MVTGRHPPQDTRLKKSTVDRSGLSGHFFGRGEYRDTRALYSVDPAIRDTTIKRTQVREIYNSVKRSGR